MRVYIVLCDFHDIPSIERVFANELEADNYAKECNKKHVGYCYVEEHMVY